MNFSSIPAMFIEVCKRYGNTRTAFKFKKNGKYIGINHIELCDMVEKVALGLMELGIHKGDRVGIMSENRIEWVISSLAINSIGGIDVPIFPILTSKQAEFIYSDCEASAIIVSNNFQLNKVLQFKDSLPSLRQIIVMNEEFDSKDVFVKSFTGLMARAEEIKTPEERRAIFIEQISKIKPDDLLTLIYTSGTTGNPKGVMLTHRNLLANIRGSLDVLGSFENDTSLSYLPLCHTYERMAGFYTLLYSGCPIALAESIETISSNIIELKPSIITTVPKLLETIKKKIFAGMDREKSSKKKVFNWAIDVGVKYVRLKQNNKSSIVNLAQYKLADKLVFSKIREKMGGNIRAFLCGGAALPDDVYEFFLAVGITVLQGYGLTENSPVIAVNNFDDNEIGTNGSVLPNLEVRIAEDGEILVKGPSVMKGYWNDPIATKEAIDEDGWLYTGDIGVFTKKNHLKITDRKKNIFVSSGGKNIAPQPIENLLSQSKYIEHCVLIGDNREYITALLTPNFEQLKSLAEDFKIEYKVEDELIANTMIIRHIQKDIDYLQKDLSKFEKVRRFQILSKPFTVDGGELSPKMSIKRHIVQNKYQDMIEMMYN